MSYLGYGALGQLSAEEAQKFSPPCSGMVPGNLMTRTRNLVTSLFYLSEKDANEQATTTPDYFTLAEQDPDASLEILYNEYFRPIEWLWFWPDDLIMDMFPGLIPHSVHIARAAMWPQGLPQEVVREWSIARLQQEIKVLGGYKVAIDPVAKEFETYEKWLAALLKKYQEYLLWFKRHLERKEEKTKVITAALSSISSAVSWIPVVGWIIGLVIAAVNVSLEVHRMRETLHAVMKAGGRTYAMEMAIALTEALAQSYAEVKDTQAQVDFELMVRNELLNRLRGTANIKDGLHAAAAKANLMKWGLIAGGLGAAAALVKVVAR